MTTVLHILSSSNLKTSATRKIGAELVGLLRAKQADINVIERDLVKNPMPHLSPEVVNVFYQLGAPELAFSDQLIDEVLKADILLIEAPMHNFSIPSVLKAWIDHIVRIGRTIVQGTERLEGLAKDKKAILVFGRGGMYSDGPAKVMDYQETYLRMILGYIGITEVETIYIENLAKGQEVANESFAKARVTSNKIVNKQG